MNSYLPFVFTQIGHLNSGSDRPISFASKQFLDLSPSFLIKVNKFAGISLDASNLDGLLRPDNNDSSFTFKTFDEFNLLIIDDFR